MKTLKQLQRKWVNKMAKTIKQLNAAQKEDIVYLNKCQEEWEQGITDQTILEDNPDYNGIKSLIFKLEKKAKVDLSKIHPDAKKKLARDILNPKFKRCIDLESMNSVAVVKDLENKIVAEIVNPRTISDILWNVIAEDAELNEVTYPPVLMKELIEYWKAYGDKIDKIETYGGIGSDDWCLGKCLIKPVAGPMPTWQRYLDRMNDAGAFAAYIYGIVSKKYRGRQLLWFHGSNGGDGKSLVQKVIAENCFANVAHPMSNDAFAAGKTFTAAEFVGKAFGYMDDCNNSMLLFKEIIKQLSAGADGNKIRSEKKGVDATDEQLETRIWVNSNFAPEVSNDNFVRSRLLYIKISPLKEKADPTIKDKFIAELPQFLEFGRQCFEMLADSDYNIEQNEEAEHQIDSLVSDHNEQFDIVFNKCFKHDINGSVKCGTIASLLSDAGLKDNVKRGNFYRWMLTEFGYDKTPWYEGSKRGEEIKGICVKDWTEPYRH
jgi:hypothetical protein